MFSVKNNKYSSLCAILVLLSAGGLLIVSKRAQHEQPPLSADAASPEISSLPLETENGRDHSVERSESVTVVDERKTTTDEDTLPKVIYDASGNLILEHKLVNGPMMEIRKTYTEDGELLLEESSAEGRTVWIGQDGSRILEP